MDDHSRSSRLALLCWAAVGITAWLVTGLVPASAQDTANSSAAFWIEEAGRQRLRVSQGQRIRRLMPRREFARPTLWHERPMAAERPRPRITPVSLPSSFSTRPVKSVSTPRSGAGSGSVVSAPEPSLVTAPPNLEPAATPSQGTPASPGQKPFAVAVIGDNLAQWLAAGLAEAYPPGSGLIVVGKTKDSSGLVRDDFYDWPRALRELVNTDKPDVLVVMVGSNDRQALRGPTGTEEPRSKGWEVLYGKRVDAVVTIAREMKVPVLWVGNPVMKNDRFSSDIGQINEIEHARVEAGGARFIDVFDAFADERGQYSAFGPDVNGQIVKLRSGDGVHFTMPGARKLAHFLESDLRRLRETANPPGLAAVPSADSAVIALTPPSTANETSQQAVAIAARPSVIVSPAPPPERAAAGPILPLTAPPLSPGGELLGRSGLTGTRVTDAQRAAIETLLTRNR